MVQFVPPQYALNGGIYGPRLAQREDTEAYYAAVRDMLNLRPLVEGGLEARGGFRFGALMRGPLTILDISGMTFTEGDSVTFTEAGDTVMPTSPNDDPPPFPGGTNEGGFDEFTERDPS